METRKLPSSNFFFFLFFAAAESDRGYQGDNQEKPSQVSESPGQRNKNPQGKNATRSKVSSSTYLALLWSFLAMDSNMFLNTTHIKLFPCPIFSN
jgi:hypothetical protein